MREALRLVLEEGLEARWERHLQNQQALIAGLEAMGLELFVANPADRLVTVTGREDSRRSRRREGAPAIARRIQYRNRRRIWVR